MVVLMVRSPLDNTKQRQRETDRARPVRLDLCLPFPLPKL
jgi:hypothetical protein